MSKAVPQTWPSGQRRSDLRDQQRFTPAQFRAGRALLGLTTEMVAILANRWPFEVRVTDDQVKAFEAGEQLGELEHAALCLVLYRDGYGVIALHERGAGEGVRFALPAEKRAIGTLHDRKWRPRIEAAIREGERIKAEDAASETAERQRIQAEREAWEARWGHLAGGEADQ